MTMLELHQSSWTRRRFRGGRLCGASRVDRWYLPLSSAALSLFVDTCSVGGDVYSRDYPSDHLPDVCGCTLGPPHPSDSGDFSDILRHGCVEEQLDALKMCARGPARAIGTASARNRARLAIRAWRILSEWGAGGIAAMLRGLAGFGASC